MPYSWDYWFESTAGLIFPYRATIHRKGVTRIGVGYELQSPGSPLHELPYTYANIIDEQRPERMAITAPNEEQAWKQYLLEIWELGVQMKLIWSMYELVREDHRYRVPPLIPQETVLCPYCMEELSPAVEAMRLEEFKKAEPYPVACNTCGKDVTMDAPLAIPLPPREQQCRTCKSWIRNGARFCWHCKLDV